jgi:hypothetical protein
MAPREVLQSLDKNEQRITVGTGIVGLIYALLYFLVKPQLTETAKAPCKTPFTLVKGVCTWVHAAPTST